MVSRARRAPSTYAAILSTIQERGYAAQARLFPTELGTLVNDLLVASFPDVLNSEFTAQMEEHLDRVEEGDEDWVSVLREFYAPFSVDLARAESEMRDVKRHEEPTQLVCDKCGAAMVKRWGRRGYFIACSAYPECRNTSDSERGGLVSAAWGRRVRRAARDVVTRTLRPPRVLALSDCKRKPISLGVDCPRPACGGFRRAALPPRQALLRLLELFADEVRFVLWDRPIPEPCPTCAAPFVVRKESKRGTTVRCVKENCGFKQELSAET